MTIRPPVCIISFGPIRYPITMRNLYNEDISAPPFLVDLDGDGDLEVVIGTTGTQSYIHCYHHNGSSYAAFPIPIGNRDTQIFSYCLGDIQPEIIVLAYHRPVTGLFRVYMMRLNGTALPGWPVDLEQWPNGTPAIVDVDNDARQYVCFTAFDGSVYACSSDGLLIPGFPKKIALHRHRASALGTSMATGCLS